MNWGSIDRIDIASLDIPQYEVMLRGMLGKDRILDIIENFILFQESNKSDCDAEGNKIGDKKTIIKILAGYH
ncbi:hypothetical protein [Clostridium sp. DL-VIII]|uniref:hypothetical protein n=1 Tax=Clostridium sp. DL-VIII TaxID=641107 RepID=UPI00031C55AC|nr:hypothetical protein [Clostridium sp. DL-VIII]